LDLICYEKTNIHLPDLALDLIQFYTQVLEYNESQNDIYDESKNYSLNYKGAKHYKGSSRKFSVRLKRVVKIEY